MIPYEKIVGTAIVPDHRFKEIFYTQTPGMYDEIYPEVLELLGPRDTWSYCFLHKNGKRIASFAFTDEKIGIFFKLKYS